MNPVQEAHVAKCFPETREDMTRYLTAGVDVIIQRQTETGPDVPPFAIAVAAQPEFWIDCANSKRAAVVLAQSLGLRVVRAQ